MGSGRASRGVWLPSDKASSFVTGALIRVDRGFGSMTI
ncbi:NAD(P)-dependent dehydrogenase (short-subunit alcohol dehydrogenase family) [Neobacillus cucumis]|nr:NAD(P)-dependent dehydrogenase (short-subunit alcohol dehydrogenase family) [Neobacillus cucumis]